MAHKLFWVMPFCLLLCCRGAQVYAQEAEPSKDWADGWSEIKQSALHDGLIPGQKWNQITDAITDSSEEEKKTEAAEKPRVTVGETTKDGQTVKVTIAIDPDGRRSDKYDYEDGHSLERVIDKTDTGISSRVVESNRSGTVTLIQTIDSDPTGQMLKMRFWYPEGTTTTEYRNGKPFKRITKTPRGEIVKTLMS